MNGKPLIICTDTVPGDSGAATLRVAMEACGVDGAEPVLVLVGGVSGERGGVRVVGAPAGGVAAVYNSLLDEARDGAAFVASGCLTRTPAWLARLGETAATTGAWCIGGITRDERGLLVCAGRSVVSMMGMREDLCQRGYGQSETPALRAVCQTDSANDRFAWVPPSGVVSGARFDPKMETAQNLAGPQARALAWDDFCLSIRACGGTVWSDGGAESVLAGADTHAALKEGVASGDWDPRAVALWQKKWRWHPQYPAFGRIRERWGETQVCWRIGARLLDSWPEPEPQVEMLMVTANNMGMLRPCLESLAATEYPKARLWVLLNGSRDGSHDYLRQLQKPGAWPFPIEVVESPVNVGCTPGLNWLLHASASGGPLVARLDDDIAVEPGWLRSLASALRGHPYAGAAGPKVLMAEDPGLIHWADYRLWPSGMNHQGERDDGRYDHLSRTVANMGCCVLYRRRAIDEAGPFDIALNPVAWEDLDHQIAVRQAGYDVLFEGRVSVRHPFKALRDHCRRVAGNMQGNGVKTVLKWGVGAWGIIERGLDLEGRILAP